MRSLVPFACAGLILTGATLAQDRSLTPGPIKTNSNSLQEAPTTPGALPRGTVIRVPGANNAPYTPFGVTPGTPRLGAGAGTINNPAGGGNLIYDNGDADGINGYSDIAHPVGSGSRRTVLDDFTVGASDWLVGCIEWTSVHGAGEPAGLGIGAEFDFRNDAGGTPGAVFATANVTFYNEIETGNVFFSRPEIAHTSLIDPVNFGAGGTYWWEGTVVTTGLANNFWLTATQQGNECWVNYEDFSGLVSGTSQFGVPSDMNFKLFEGGDPPPPSCGEDELVNNGLADGVNGYSNIAQPVGSGLRRTMLDDFNVPAGKVHDVTCIQWTSVHGAGEPAGLGIDAEFDIRNDASGSPGAPIATANVTAYTEGETGGVFFSRPEIAHTATFDAINLGAGTYWWEGTVVTTGLANNFWLTAPQIGNECWVNYEDFSGLVSGTSQFGTASDVNFQVYGTESNEPLPPTCKIYDNGDADGVNGYSNIAQPVGSGSRRTMLDDFNVPAGETWVLASICWTSVHGSGEPAGLGIGAELDLRNDAGGTPGAAFATANVTGYNEEETGNVFFSRPEISHVAVFDGITLGTGTYWWEGTVVTTGLANNFWLTAPQQGNECWVNYEDFSGLVSGTSQFGVPSDMNFKLGVNRIGTNYCDAKANSSGTTGLMWATGSETVTDQNVMALACFLPTGEFGYLLNGPNTANIPVSDGVLCVGGGIGRHTSQIGNSGAAGEIKTVLDLTALPRPSGGPATVQPGDTWYFQLWHRDGQQSNFTDAVCITFN